MRPVSETLKAGACSLSIMNQICGALQPDCGSLRLQALCSVHHSSHCLYCSMSTSSFMTAASTHAHTPAVGTGSQPASPIVRDYAFRPPFQAVNIGTPFRINSPARPETPIGMGGSGQPVGGAS